MSDEFNDDYRRGYNDAIRFYDKHDAERQWLVETLTRERDVLRESLRVTERALWLAKRAEQFITAFKAEAEH
jgi:dsDNA-binding SOS-regulon protein